MVPKANGGTAVIVRTVIKHHETEKYSTEHLQMTSIVIEDGANNNIICIYTPLRNIVKQTSIKLSSTHWEVNS